MRQTSFHLTRVTLKSMSLLRPDNKSTSNMLDVDTRFLLANERTFLAWVRTALTVIAAGLALNQLGGNGSAEFGVIIILFGAGTALTGYLRYQAADTAIRSHRLPAHGKGPILQVITVVGLALILVVIELIQLSAQ